MGLPGTMPLSVAAGTAGQAAGTFWISPGRNVVISEPGVTVAGPDPPGTTRTTTSAATMTAAAVTSHGSGMRRLPRFR